MKGLIIIGHRLSCTLASLSTPYLSSCLITEHPNEPTGGLDMLMPMPMPYVPIQRQGPLAPPPPALPQYSHAGRDAMIYQKGAHMSNTGITLATPINDIKMC